MACQTHDRKWGHHRHHKIKAKTQIFSKEEGEDSQQ
jgi:hypothetical protein